MNTPCSTHRRLNLATLLKCVVVCAPLLTEIHFEARQRQQAQTLDEAIKDITRGQVSPVILRELVDAGASQAVPALKQQFAVNADSRTKQVTRIRRTDLSCRFGQSCCRKRRALPDPLRHAATDGSRATHVRVHRVGLFTQHYA